MPHQGENPGPTTLAARDGDSRLPPSAGASRDWKGALPAPPQGPSAKMGGGKRGQEAQASGNFRQQRHIM